MKSLSYVFLLSVVCVSILPPVLAQKPSPEQIRAEPRSSIVGHDDTPFLPGQKWRVHDAARPHPRQIAAGSESSQDLPGRPPSDAIILFDGKDLSAWLALSKTSTGQEQLRPPTWKVGNGYFEDDKKSASLVTKEKFGNCQLHVEWMTPVDSARAGQARGNSGVLLMSRYEIQVLDSFENPTYADGQSAALYGQWPPLVNASRPPGVWQTYDIYFEAPRFEGDKVLKPATVTVVHNGVLVHHHAQFIGFTEHAKVGTYRAHTAEDRLMLQSKGFGVRYRNIWIRGLNSYDDAH